MSVNSGERTAQSRPKTARSPQHPAIGKYVSAMVIALLLCESIAIYGLALFFIGKKTLDLYILIIFIGVPWALIVAGTLRFLYHAYFLHFYYDQLWYYLYIFGSILDLAIIVDVIYIVTRSPQKYYVYMAHLIVLVVLHLYLALSVPVFIIPGPLIVRSAYASVFAPQNTVLGTQNQCTWQTF